MSIILSGLIHIFRPLLSSLSGALDCEGLAPWYFLLGLRIVAIFFSNGPWDTVKQDVACSWVIPMHERSQDFCTAMCHNQHFPFSVAAMWGLVFIVVLLLVGLMRLSSPKKKKEKENGDKERNGGLAIVANAPHGSSADISTIYMVGRRGLPRSYRSRYRHSTHHADWADWHGPHVAPMAEEHGTNVAFGPCEAGGYGMPVYSRHKGQTKMSEHCYDTAQHQMAVCPMDTRQTKLTAPCPGTNQYEMSPLYSHTKQTSVASHCGETEHYMPTSCAPIPFSGSPYKGRRAPQCEVIPQRYMDPEECGAGDSSDVSSTACKYTMGTPPRYMGKSKMPPRCYEDGKYHMATKCRPVTESDLGNIGVHPWGEEKANMAIKRRPVHGVKMKTRRHVTFDGTSRSNMGFGGDTCAQPWVADDPNMADNCAGMKIITGPGTAAEDPWWCHGDMGCTCAETDPCHCEPQCEPHCHEEASHSSHHHHPRQEESLPGPQDHAKMTITKICGVPLFDVWVALLLATEITFLCIVILLQMPRLIGRSWICTPGATSCPPAVECTVKGRAEKRVALWSLAFTSILFIIACSGYFNLRLCWNRRCRRMCGEEEGEKREEVCVADPEPEGRVFRGDVEGGTEGNGEEGSRELGL